MVERESMEDVFDLPVRLAAKNDPRLIGADTRHLVRVAAQLASRVAALESRRAELTEVSVRRGRGAMERDEEIHRLGGQLRLLRRYGLDVCLGRMVPVGGDPVYLGRIGLLGADDQPLLIDWRAPAAEPFFAATQAQPMGLASRRRYRWSGGRIRDYWDEVLAGGGETPLALDADSAFLAGLVSERTGRMPDVLATIQADQDAIVRAGSAGALVVEGGPGTGKTVVALHRAAYLLYGDPRLAGQRGGVLVVGPHEPYLGYIADVLPDLGEDGVLTCTLRDLVPEGATALVEDDPEVARLKAAASLAEAIEPAVALYEEPPRETLLVETEYVEVEVEPADWAEAFESRDPEMPHNEARDQVWAALIEILADKGEAEELSEERIRRALQAQEELREAFARAWPILDGAEVVGDLWTVPAYLRRCAPWLSREEVQVLQRAVPDAWTIADLPLLDAARRRVGDPRAPGRARRREAALAEQRAAMDELVEYLLDTDDDPDSSLPLLRRESIRTALVDEGVSPAADRDRLAGPFAHIIVDEAQELTDAEWQMLLRRCPSRSFTIVGDRAQARHGFVGSWAERLRGLGFTEIATASLNVNYRTPAEIMAEAEPEIRRFVPDASVPRSIRRSGIGVQRVSVDDLDAIVESWLAAHPEGVACVIGAPTFRERDRVRSLTPQTAKGLEFDLVVLVDPDRFADGIEGAVDRYVAMTRATQRLVVAQAAADSGS